MYIHVLANKCICCVISVMILIQIIHYQTTMQFCERATSISHHLIYFNPMCCFCGREPHINNFCYRQTPHNLFKTWSSHPSRRQFRCNIFLRHWSNIGSTICLLRLRRKYIHVYLLNTIHDLELGQRHRQ